MFLSCVARCYALKQALGPALGSAGRQEKIVAEMERQTEEIQQKMEAQLAAEVRQGDQLRERIEALQERLREVDFRYGRWQETYTSVSDQLEMSQISNEKLQVRGFRCVSMDFQWIFNGF